MIVCPACDLAHRPAAAPLRGKLECVRCHAPLLRPDRAPIDRAIAVALCALVLFVLTNAYPIVAMQASGTTRMTTLAGAAYGLYAQGFRTSRRSCSSPRWSLRPCRSRCSFTC